MKVFYNKKNKVFKIGSVTLPESEYHAFIAWVKDNFGFAAKVKDFNLLFEVWMDYR